MFLFYANLSTIKIQWNQAADHFAFTLCKLFLKTKRSGTSLQISFSAWFLNYFSGYILLTDQILLSGCLKVLEYLQKIKTLKITLSCTKFCYWTKVKAKHVFLSKIMLWNEIQAFFVSVCFFVLMFFKSNSVTFCFSLSLTWCHTNY